MSRKGRESERERERERESARESERERQREKIDEEGAAMEDLPTYIRNKSSRKIIIFS